MKSIQYQNQRIQPSKIVCIGRNYVEHIAELNNEVPDEMVVFIKPNSAIADAISFNQAEEVHYEGELVFLIKGGQLAAVGFGLDLTKRQLQTRLKEKGLPWERAKAFDGAAILSGFVPFDSLNDLRLELYINDELKQKGGCQQMMYPPRVIVEELNTFMTLVDGDLIMTGTPKGVGVINSGDQFSAKVYQGEELLLSQSWQVD